MNGCDVHVVFDGDLKSGLEAAAEQLAELGYEKKKLSDDSLEMKFNGKWFTTDPAKMKHSVSVTHDGTQLTFAFGTGLIASHWSESDRAWAQQRADEVVAAVRAKLD